MSQAAVRYLREQQDVTQAQLASILHVTQPRVSQVLSGGRRMPLYWAVVLSHAFKVNLARLFSPQDVSPHDIRMAQMAFNSTFKSRSFSASTPGTVLSELSTYIQEQLV